MTDFSVSEYCRGFLSLLKRFIKIDTAYLNVSAHLSLCVSMKGLTKNFTQCKLNLCFSFSKIYYQFWYGLDQCKLYSENLVITFQVVVCLLRVRRNTFSSRKYKDFETCSCCIHHQNLSPTSSSVNIDKCQNGLVISSYLGHRTLLIFGLGITNCYCPFEFSQIEWQFSTADQQKFS